MELGSLYCADYYIGLRTEYLPLKPAHGIAVTSG